MLKNRLPEIEIPKGNPFENDKLDRKTCANIFVNIVKLYKETGCVIALNGEWGSGKTTFVKMVQQELQDREAHPLYFNAWENDYVSDPLIAILSELKEVCPDSSKWNNVIANGSKIALSMGAAVIKGLIKSHTGISFDTISAGIDEAENILRNNIDEFKEQKKSLQEFRKALQGYIADNSSPDTPIVFFIDELDRCNPQFAVLVLERIKHFFDIPNIVFVLSINKKQLGYAVQGYYGSANIDANNYLRRFIDIEYTLPRPNIDVFCEYLRTEYGFEELFNNEQRKFIYNFDSFVKVSNALVSASKIDFRTADKIYAHTRLTFMEFDTNDYINQNALFLLCYIKIVIPDLYSNIINEKYSLQELLNEIEDCLFFEVIGKEDTYNTVMKYMINTIALLICMYNLDGDGIERVVDISLKTKYINESELNNCLRNYKDSRDIVKPLISITKKIELGENIQFDKYNDEGAE